MDSAAPSQSPSSCWRSGFVEVSGAWICRICEGEEEAKERGKGTYLGLIFNTKREEIRQHDRAVFIEPMV